MNTVKEVATRLVSSAVNETAHGYLRILDSNRQKFFVSSSMVCLHRLSTLPLSQQGIHPFTKC